MYNLDVSKDNTISKCDEAWAYSASLVSVVTLPEGCNYITGNQLIDPNSLSPPTTSAAPQHPTECLSTLQSVASYRSSTVFRLQYLRNFLSPESVRVITRWKIGDDGCHAEHCPSQSSRASGYCFPFSHLRDLFFKITKKGASAKRRRAIIRGIIHSRGCCLSRILIRLGELVAIDNWNFSSFNFGNFLPILLYLPIFVRIDRKLLLASLNYLRFINIKEKRQRERERDILTFYWSLFPIKQINMQLFVPYFQSRSCKILEMFQFSFVLINFEFSLLIMESARNIVLSWRRYTDYRGGTPRD